MKQLVLLTMLLFVFTSCDQMDVGSTKKEGQPTKMSTAQTTQSVNQYNAKRAKDLLLKKDEIKWVRAVEAKDLLLVGIEWKHWHTPKAKSLNKKMKKELEKELNIKEIKVTNDHKIFIELEKLEEKLEAKELSQEQLDEQLKKINKLMEEQM